MEFTWNVIQMDRLTSDGFVTTVHYNVSVVDVNYTSSTYGTVNFTESDKPMKPFADLTEAEVIGWVQEALNKDEVEANLSAQIEAQKNPVSKAGLPWAVSVL